MGVADDVMRRADQFGFGIAASVAEGFVDEGYIAVGVGARHQKNAIG